MGAIEYRNCEVCGNAAPLQRKYYRYNIKCDCHSPQHFELVSHCDNCTPVEPETTTIYRGKEKLTVKTSTLEKLNEQN